MILTRTIENFRKKIKRTLFTTPSHGQKMLFNEGAKNFLGEQYFSVDYSEIDGFDDLRNPDGIIAESLLKASEIYQTKATFFLTNGSSSGIVASMLATLKRGDKVLINRNAHVSVFNGLVLTCAVPIWLDAQRDEEWGITKPVSVDVIKKALIEHSDIKALIITNPTYEGLSCEIEEIAKICKENNILLIVDEAHGALWSFTDKLGMSATKTEADICVQSLHKTAGAINPAALLHISKNSNVDIKKIQNALNLITTTSPSYPLLANIEQTICFLNSKQGKNEIDKLLKNIDNFFKEILQYENVSAYCVDKDITKILVKIDDLSGFALENCIFDKFNIEAELVNSKSVMFLTGLGTTKNKLDKLKNAICKIAKNPQMAKVYETDYLEPDCIKPIFGCLPCEANLSDSKKTAVELSVGKISKETIVATPPCIPLLFAGEMIQKEHISYLKQHYDTIETVIR